MIDFTKIRMLLIIALVLLGGVLYSYWEQEQGALVTTQSDVNVIANEIPSVPVPVIPETTSSIPSNQQAVTKGVNLIQVDTDVLHIEIDLEGGDIVYSDLKQYPIKKAGD